MKKSIAVLLMYFVSLSLIHSQNNLCGGALPFCTDTVYDFPAGVNAGSGQSGPNYGCLSTTPNPAWYYMEVLNPGNIVIYMSSTPSVDIDFALWGPFSDPTSPCVAQLTANCGGIFNSCPNNTSNPNFYPSGNLVDCSYSTSWNETAHIIGAQTGEVYILLITNFSNQPCNINFLQQNAGQPGAGSTNCGILAPPVDNNGPLCEGATLNLIAQAGPTGCSYSWTGPNNFTSSDQNPVITNVTLAHAGEYFLQVILGTDTSNAVSTTVVVHPVPTSDFTVSLDSICIDETTALNYTGTATPAATYTWDVDGGTPNVISGPGPHNVSWASQGHVNVTLTVSENGCTSPPTTIPIYIKPIPTSSFTVISPVCQGNNSTISFTGTASANAIYNWSFSGANVNSGANQGPYELSWNTPGSYSLELVVVDDGCTSPSTYQTINVLPLPNIDITSDVNDGCMPLTVTFSDNNNAPPATFSWNFGDGNTDNTYEPTHTFNNAGTYIITLTVTDTSGCVNSTTSQIIVHPLPQANFIFTPEVGSVGLTINFNSSTSTGNINQWAWDFGNDNVSTDQNPTTVYGETGYHTIWLLVETVNGCLDSTSKQILIVDIVIPNVFTPNNDGYNDYFVIDGIELVSNCQLVVFNRWGKKVYESYDYKNDWDGDGLADGTYYFIFTMPESIIEPINGTVTILR